MNIDKRKIIGEILKGDVSSLTKMSSISKSIIRSVLIRIFLDPKFRKGYFDNVIKIIKALSRVDVKTKVEGTKVVNVKVKYIRPEFKDLKEWIESNDNVYIGRKGIVFIDNERFPKKDSPFANPFKVKDEKDRDKSIKLYKSYIEKKIENKEVDISILKGKNLGCWCKKPDGALEPEKDISCHGDVLLELLNSIKTYTLSENVESSDPLVIGDDYKSIEEIYYGFLDNFSSDTRNKLCLENGKIYSPSALPGYKGNEEWEDDEDQFDMESYPKRTQRVISVPSFETVSMEMKKHGIFFWDLDGAIYEIKENEK